MSSPAPIWEQLLNTAKDFMDEKKWGIKADNAILTPQQLEEAHPKIEQDSNHPAWSDPLVDKNSEYSAKTNTIHVRPGYDIERDFTRNIVHEKSHAYMSQIAKVNWKRSLRRYPEGVLEQVAYTTQFYYLIKDGYTLDDVKKMGEWPVFFKRHGEVLTKYFNYAQKKYNEEQVKQKILSEKFLAKD